MLTVNIPEINSTCQAKNPRSLSKIDQSISKARTFYGTEDGKGWKTGFYQYANRLAHLYFFRELSGIDPELVFIYFCDYPSHVGTSTEEWRVALTAQKKTMGIRILR